VSQQRRKQSEKREAKTKELPLLAQTSGATMLAENACNGRQGCYRGMTLNNK
jgi:hypothetical protein